jgi:tetratricopeptide (TPR) repeat protein
MRVTQNPWRSAFLALSGVLLLALSYSRSNAQSDEAETLAMRGIEMVDNESFDEGIKLLKAARNKRPSEYDFPLEIAKAYLKKDDPKKAERYLFELQYHKSVQPDLFILLSECYSKLEDAKKNPDETRKKETDALLYGIGKFPSSGMLYLKLGHIYQQLEKPIDALAIWEKGIQKDPTYAENYFWASRILQMTGNHLWAWLYGETFWNMTDDAELGRAIAANIIVSADKVLSGQWTADPEKTDQDFAFLVKEKCSGTGSNLVGMDKQNQMRDCLLRSSESLPDPLIPFFSRLHEIRERGWQTVYLAHLYQDQDRVKFIDVVTQNPETTDQFRNWFYWNRMKPTAPISRLN